MLSYTCIFLQDGTVHSCYAQFSIKVCKTLLSTNFQVFHQKSVTLVNHKLLRLCAPIVFCCLTSPQIFDLV